MRTPGGHAMAKLSTFALRSARKLVRGLREEMTDEERYRVARAQRSFAEPNYSGDVFGADR